MAESEITMLSFKNENKLIKAVKKGYKNNWNDEVIYKVAYKSSEKAISEIKKIIELTTIKQALKLNKNDFQTKLKQRKK